MSTPKKERKGDNITFVLPAPRSARVAQETAAPAERQPIVPPVGSRPKTGPGLTTMEILDNATLRQKVGELEQEVQRLAGERGPQQLDPREVAPSRWANRHADSFKGPEFDAFKTEILDAGGNVQPIMVRPLANAGTEGGPKYEVVFGHRRHRACLELGLKINAVVKPLGDRELFGHMERENRLRRNLSAYEQGVMYRRAIDEGMFPSLRQLATFIGRAPGDVSNALHIAQLPQEVLEAFPSPNDIQFRWIKKLKDALERNRQGLMAAAAQAAAEALPAAKAFKLLTAVDEGQGVRPSNTPQASAAPAGAFDGSGQHMAMDLGQGRLAAIRSESGRTVLELDAALLPPERWGELQKALRRLMK
jgi:ParB family chromosome partitioning protein